MRQTVKADLDAYVETQRSRRRQARHDAEWQRWAERAALAERAGRLDLAEAARQQALHLVQFNRASNPRQEVGGVAFQVTVTQ